MTKTITWKIMSLITTMALLMTGLSACSQSPTGQVTKETLRVGIIAPLSGDAAIWGTPVQEAVEFAAAESALAIELIAQDSACDPKQGISAMNQLIRQDVDVVIGAVCSSVTLAIAPLAEEQGIVVISPASTSPDITTAGDYIFRVVPTDALRGKVFAQAIAATDAEHVAIMYINNNLGKALAEVMKNSLEQDGKQVSWYAYAESSTDLRAELTKVQHSNAESLVIVSYPADTIVALRQVEELGIQLPIYLATEAAEDASVIEDRGNSLDGISYIVPAPAQNTVADQFKQDFSSRAGHPPAMFAAESYDAMNIVMQLWPGCQTSSCLKDRLYLVKGFQGTSGSITFDDNGDVLKSMAIKQYVGSEPKIVQTIAP